MPCSTLFKYLIGDKRAILEIAHSRSSLWIGFLFVLSAGLAREYDHESLWHQPWHALIPIGASTLVAFALFVLFYVIRPVKELKRPPFAEGFRSVLALVWMTAPLAWLYAIPYERMFDAGSATEANLWTLAIVAVWRVLLISRALAVVLNMRSIGTFFVVMLLADAVALTLLSIVPLPIFNVMGGISLSASESLIASTSFAVMALGMLSAPIWLLGALGIMALHRTEWNLQPQPPRPQLSRGRLWVPAAAAIAFGVALLPLTQPPQARRHQVERALQRGDIQGAIGLMSKHEVSDFPPHWDPPPRRGYGQREPDITLIVEEIERQNAPEWVRQTYVRKLHDQARAELRYVPAREPWQLVADRIKKFESINDVDRARATLVAILRVDRALALDDRTAIESLLALSKPGEIEAELSNR